jgi:hypothetical protein
MKIMPAGVFHNRYILSVGNIYISILVQTAHIAQLHAASPVPFPTLSVTAPPSSTANSTTTV